MLDLKKLISKSVILITSDVISKGIIFVINILLARHFGPNVFGVYSMALGIALLMSFISELGLNKLVLVDASHDDRDISKLVSASWILRMISMVLIVIPTSVIVYFMNNEVDIKLLISLSIFMVFQNIYEFFLSILKIKYKLIKEAVLKISLALCIVVLYFYAVASKGDIYYFAFGNTLLMILFSFICFYTVRNIFSYKISLLKFSELKTVLNKSWPFALSLIFISLYYNLDSVMIGLYFPKEYVGWYSASYKLLIIVLTVQNLFSIIVLPNIRKNLNKTEALRNYVEKLSLLMNVFQVPLIIGMIYFSGFIINVMYDNDFLEAQLPFMILSTNIMFVGWSIISGIWILTSFEKEKIMTFVVGIGAFINIILNLLLIPKFGMTGAAFATIITEIIVSMLMYRQAIKYLDFNLFSKIKRILPLTIVSIFISLTYMNNNMLVSFTLFLVVYSLGVYLLKIIQKEDFNLLLYEKN
jgi:O-antigen/teichoic acid export membrane protein